MSIHLKWTFCALCEVTGGQPQSGRAVYSIDNVASLSDIFSISGNGIIPNDEQLFIASEEGNLYFVHSPCWDFFAHYFNSDELDLERLLEILKIEGRPRYLWDTSLGGLFTKEANNSMIGAHACALPRPKKALQRCPVTRTNSTDPFVLPAEIKHEIAGYVDMASYFNLRHASREMATLFHSQSFWRERFGIHRERGFLYTITEEATSHEGDWRKLYQKTRPSRIWASGGLCYHRRQRIQAKHTFWCKMNWIRDLCLTTRVLTIPLSVKEQKVTIHLNWKGMGKRKGGTSLKERGKHRLVGAKKSQQSIVVKEVLIHESVIQIGFWTLKGPRMVSGTRMPRSKTSITGMELITNSIMKPNTSIGYRIPGSQSIVDIGSASQLRGFDISPSGKYVNEDIAAIQVRTAGGAKPQSDHRSRWIGSPEGHDGEFITRTCRPPFQQRVIALKAGFVDEKMVSLAIGTHPNPKPKGNRKPKSKSAA